MEIFSYSFFYKAMLMAVFGGLSCGIVGVWILLLNIPFVGIAMAHAAFAGAMVGMFFGLNPIIISLLFCIITAILIEPISKFTKLHNNVSISILFSFMLAIALLFSGILKSYNIEIFNFIWGNILTVTKQNIIFNLILFCVLILFCKLFHNGIMAVFFDREVANLLGIPVKLIITIIMLFISITISFNLKSIGALLIYSLLVLPAISAYQLTYNINKMYILSSIFAVFSSVLGILISSLIDISVSATIILILCFICIVTTFLFNKK